MLNRLFYSFDSLLRKYPNIYKLDLIGDCFMAAAGLHNHVGGGADGKLGLPPNATREQEASYHACAMLRCARRGLCRWRGMRVKLGHLVLTHLILTHILTLPFSLLRSLVGPSPQVCPGHHE